MPPTPPYPADGKLRWAPPPLTNPETVQAGSGFTELKLNRSKDYIVVMPSSTKLGGTSIDGGRNVVIVGGHLTVPPQLLPTADADRQRRALYVKDTAGTVHIEGLLIDGSGGGQSDGIAISAPDAIVQVQNTRIVGLRGGESTWHADLIQPWGGVKELRVDRLTGSSTYQGLHIAPDLKPIGGSTLSRVNLSSAEGPLDRGGYMLWMTRGSDSCEATPTSLSDVFIAPRSDKTLGRSAWPSIDAPQACAARERPGVVDWPNLGGVTGGVRGGAPPGGDYAPSGSIGLGYVSPGA